MWRARLDAEALLNQIDVLARKQREGKHGHALLGGELGFGALGDRAPQFARELAGTIARGEYRAGPVKPTRALIDGKPRTLYRSEAIDMIVTATLAADLTPRLESSFSDHLYSYRRGRSAAQAIAALAGFVARHRRAHADPKTRGLHVVRRDVRAYGDSIPVDDDSVLWQQITRTLDPDPSTTQLLKAALRPQLAQSTEHVTSVPTGSALQPLMCNLYLTPLDNHARTIEGGFYARSGDDILFVHPDAEVARKCAAEIERILTELRLSLSTSKSLDMYWTGAGRASADWPEAYGATHLQYLGARIDFQGNIGLKSEKARLLLQHVRRRMDNTLCLIGSASLEQRANAVGDVVRATFDVTNPQSDPVVALVMHAVNDRRQLRQLDHWVALDAAQRVTGIKGPRAFRKLSYRALRRDHGLPSLIVLRHRRGKR